MKLIKEYSNEISPFLKFLTNKCFKEGCFPEQQQIGKVIPIFRKGEEFKHANHRPMSILPTFSKIFEKLFCEIN